MLALTQGTYDSQVSRAAAQHSASPPSSQPLLQATLDRQPSGTLTQPPSPLLAQSRELPETRWHVCDSLFYIFSISKVSRDLSVYLT